MATKLLWLAMGGAAGTLCRVGLSTLVTRHSTASFPLGTMAVNLLGCLPFGVVWSVADRRGTVSPTLQLALLGGFMGAFTTFSTFAFDTAQLARASHLGFAAANLAIQNVLGIGCLFAGLALGRVLTPLA